jgi:hypothetical protein
MKRLGLACVLAIALPRVGVADEPAPAPAPEPAPATEPAPAPAPAPVTVPTPDDERAPVTRVRSRDITIEVPGERSRNNKLIIGGIFGGGVLVSALGLYYHLDSRDAANEVSADRFNGKSWTEKQEDLVARADRSKTRATVAYAIGGGLLIGAIVAYIVTAPKSETAVIHTGGVVVVPTDEGGMVTRMWSF